MSSTYRLPRVGFVTPRVDVGGFGMLGAFAVEVPVVGALRIKPRVSKRSLVTSPFISDTLVGLVLGLLDLRMDASWILVCRSAILVSRSCAAVSGVSAVVGLLG